MTSTFLNSTCFSLFNPFYCDSNMALPNNQTPKLIPASVVVGPMSPNEQQAFLPVNVIHHNHKDHNMKLATLLKHKAYTSLFISCLYASLVPGKKLKAPHLNHLLYSELVGNEATILHKLVDLLFPSIHINKDLLKHLEWIEPDESGVRVPGVWAGERFCDTPTKFTEQELGTWMNKVAHAMSKATRKTV